MSSRRQRELRRYQLEGQRKKQRLARLVEPGQVWKFTEEGELSLCLVLSEAVDEEKPGAWRVLLLRDGLHHFGLAGEQRNLYLASSHWDPVES